MATRTKYAKPTRELLADMLTEWALEPGEQFSAKRVQEWFSANYPLLKPGSIDAHLQQASTNDTSRLHHAPRLSDDLLYRVSSRTYRLYQPGVDPLPIRKSTVEAPTSSATGVAPVPLGEEDVGDAEREASVGSSQFLLEKDLQRYLAENLDLVEPGLTLFDDDGISGMEYPAGGGRRIDILAKDAEGGFVVLELKVEKGYDRVVGQLLRYVNWVRKELAEPGQRVRGIIVCRTMSEDLILACAGIPYIQLMEYRLQVKIYGVQPLALG